MCHFTSIYLYEHVSQNYVYVATHLLLLRDNWDLENGASLGMCLLFGSLLVHTHTCNFSIAPL